MRKNLKEFRMSRLLLQKEIAQKIGVAAPTYCDIESGKKNGGVKFWRKFKLAFDLTDEEIAALNENTEAEEVQNA